MPRTHHFKAKYLITLMAMNNSDQFLEHFTPPSGRAYFQGIWDGLGLDIPEEERVSSDGLAVVSHTLKNGQQVIILTFPEPKESNEAYFLAVPPQPEGGFVIGLESSFNPMTQTFATAFVAWTSEGRMRFADSPSPTIDAFIDAIENLLT